MKKKFVFFVFLALFCCFSISFNIFNNNFSYANAVENIEEQIYIVTSNKAYIYKQASLTSQKIASLKHKEEVILDSIENEIVIVTDENGFLFAHSNLGYLLLNQLIRKNNNVTSVPNFNAKTNSACKVFFKDVNSLYDSGINLEKGYKLFLYEGYNRKNEFTNIAFLHDNEVEYGIIETKFIEPNGINPLIIECAIIILAILGIVFAFLFMKNKKIKLKINKKKKI